MFSFSVSQFDTLGAREGVERLVSGAEGKKQQYNISGRIKKQISLNSNVLKSPK